jgi:hypothetical protein
MGSRARILLLLVIAALAGSAQAQFYNDCMDCLQKSWAVYQGTEKIVYWEALCCDAPCTGGFYMTNPDVGAGCLIADLGQSGNPRGTQCNSSDYDQGCPEPEYALPVVTPKRQEQPRNPDEGPESPIVVDLGRDGYHFTSVTSGVRFDIRNDGTPVQMGWTRLGAENAFLALDRNANGRIDHGAELFGNATPLRDGSRAANGFIALAEFDDNRDGVVDPSDDAWAALLLWTD